MPSPNVHSSVRFVSVLLGVLAGAPVLAQQATPAADGTPLQLPVSLERIRAALERSPTERLRLFERKPDFRVEIRERRRLEELLGTLDVKSGPVPAGGLYGFEQRSRLGSPWGSQPIITVDLLAIGRGIASSISSARRSGAEAAAREEVKRATADYCAAQPNRGAGLQICASSPASR